VPASTSRAGATATPGGPAAAQPPAAPIDPGSPAGPVSNQAPPSSPANGPSNAALPPRSPVQQPAGLPNSGTGGPLSHTSSGGWPATVLFFAFSAGFFFLSTRRTSRQTDS
jgi:hypothetical protein